MGATQSKTNIIGRWANGKSIYRADATMVADLAKTHGAFIVEDGTKIPADHEVWAIVDGKTYVRPASLYKKYFMQNKDKILPAVASVAKVSFDIASRVVEIALPVLMDAGAAAAIAVITIKMPILAPVAGPIIYALDQELQKMPVKETMGKLIDSASSSISGAYMDMPPTAYIGAAERLANETDARFGSFYSGGFDSDFVEGGCGCRGGFIGAAELDTATVRDYTNSLNAKTKQSIIDTIISAATKLGLNVTGADNQAKIKSLLEQIPTGDRFRKDDATHRTACKGIADVINSVHGTIIVPSDLPPEVICQQVAEIVSSLSAGMHTEFLAVYNDVRRVLKNLYVLKSSLDDTHNAVMDRIKNSDDALLRQQLTTLDDLHKLLTAEIERQTQLLSNLLNVTLFPEERNLAALIKNKKDIHGYIEKIDVKLGSDKFGKVISDILRGLGLTANFALVIDRALKTVGMKMDEYANMKTMQDLRMKITQGLMGKSLTDAELHEYLNAADLLYKNLYRNQEIKEKAAEVTGSHEFIGGDFMSESEYAKTVTDKRILDRKRLRNLIFNAFFRQLNDLFDKFVVGLDQLTNKIGVEIPLSDQLDGFRQIIQRVNDSLVRNKDIYYALIGYYNDALSRSKKDTLVGDLKMVSSFIDTILEMPLYKSSAQYFVNIQSHLKSMIELIDRYSDEIAAKFGRAEVPSSNIIGSNEGECPNLDNIFHDEDNTDTDDNADFTGSYAGGIDTSVDPPIHIKYKSTKTINDAIRQFDYRYRVAQIKYNMTATSREVTHYSEKYEKIIANSIADILSNEKKKYEVLRKELDNSRKESLSDTTTARGYKTKDEINRQFNAASRILDDRWETKKRFWATVEAVDTYMRVFTDAMIKNPNDIKEIKSMLDEVEIINDWYDESTGDDLTTVFEFFPSFIKDDAIADDDLFESPYTDMGGEHYYTKIGTKVREVRPAIIAGNNHAARATAAAKAYPGNPHLVANPDRGAEAIERAKKTFTGLAILKNLLSVFVNIGSKFGGEELRKKVFMTPTQMYNNLVNYLHVSAFAQGWGNEDPLNSNFASSFGSTDKMTISVNFATGEIAEHADRVGVWNPDFNYTYGTEGANIGFVHLGLGVKKNVEVFGNPDLENAYHSAVEKSALYTQDMVAMHVDPAAAAGQQGNVLNVDRIAKYGQPVGNAFPWLNAPKKATNDHIANILRFKKRWGIWMRSINKKIGEMEGFGFKNEDKYFVLILKSIAAKIFTVTGLYDVFDRPLEFNGLSPIRMITGGNTEIPKIEEGAVALYLRLPLLAQFYRSIFDWDGDGEFKNYSDMRRRDTSIKISMVPDVDGVFAGLMRLVFRKTKFIDSSSYSDEDIKEIIREVNLIYQRMKSKHPDNTVMETIYEFVAEVNRRYGVVSQEERNNYEREFGFRYSYASAPPDDRSRPYDRYDAPPDVQEYAILPGETEDEIERPSAAQRLLGERFETPSEKKSPFTVTIQHKDLVNKFRCAIDKYFEKPEEEYTFNNAIKATQLKLKNESRDEERFRIITSLVRGVDIYSKVDGMKYIMFHETVVSGLNLLSAIHSMLAMFRERVTLIDVESIEKYIWETFDNRVNELEKNANRGVSITIDGFIGEVRNKLFENLVENADTTVLEERFNNVFGKRQAYHANGGHTNTDFALKGVDGVGAGANGNVRMVKLWPDGNFGLLKGNTPGQHGFEDTIGFTYNYRQVALNPTANDQNGKGGLISIFLGENPREIHKAWKTGKPVEKARKAETFLRFVFDREYIMKELLEIIYGLGYDFQDLVNIKIDDGKIHINYGGLKQLIEDTFNGVGYFLDLLRSHIKPELLSNYTNKFQPGSYYWLQEQLMEKIIVGRPPSIDSKSAGYDNLDSLTRKLSSTWGYLTKEWNVDGRGLEATANGLTGRMNVSNSNAETKLTSYDKVFAQMIFYDSSKPQSGLIRSELADVVDGHHVKGGLSMVEFLHDPYEALHFNGPQGAKILDTRFIARFKQLYSWRKELTLNRSSMFTFNQLVAKYIQTFYDPVGSKIYSGLLNQFASGSFSRPVADYKYTYPDTAPMVNIKFANPTEIKISPVDLTDTLFPDPHDRDNRKHLRDILGTYVKYGISWDDSDDEDARRDRLDYDKYGRETYTVKAADANGAIADINIPDFTFGLYIHAVAHAIKFIFDYYKVGGANAIANAADSTGGGVNGPLSVLYKLPLLSRQNITAVIESLTQGGTAADVPDINNYISKLNQAGGVGVALPVLLRTTTFGDLRGVWSGEANKDPSLENIIEMLTRGDIDATDFARNAGTITDGVAMSPKASHKETIIARLFHCCLFNDESHDDIDDSFKANGVLISILNTIINAAGQSSDVAASFLAIINKYLRFKDDVTATLNDADDNWFGLPYAALKLLPATTSTSLIKLKKYNENVLPGTLIKLYKKAYELTAAAVGGNADLAAYTKYKVELHREVNAPITILPDSQQNTQKRTKVKYDDILGANLSDYEGNFPEQVLPDGSYFRFAHSDGGIDGDTLGLMNVPRPQPHGEDNDTLNSIKEFGRRMDPDADHVLFSSLAAILRNILSSQTANSQAKVYLVDNMADIPLYVKEKMRANLPMFRNYFKQLINRCEFIKRFMQTKEVNAKRSYTMTGFGNAADYKTNIVPNRNPWPYVLRPVTVDSDETKNRYSGILDSIIKGCMSLVTSCEQVLRDVGDDPKYFETYQNSIKDYKAQYGFDPLMPMSTTLSILKNTTNSNYLDFFPIHSLGEDQFKFIYGTRSLLGQPTTVPLLEHNLGFSQMLEQFNLLVDNKLSINKDKADSFHKSFVRLLRYVYELKHIKGLLTSYVSSGDNDSINANRHSPTNTKSTLYHIDGLFTRDNLILTKYVRGDPATPRVLGNVNKLTDPYELGGPIFITNKSHISLIDDGLDKERKELTPSYRNYPKVAYAISKPLTDSLRLTESSFKDDRIKELVEYIVSDGKPRNALHVQNIIDLNIIPINVHALMREIPLVNLYNYAYTFDRLIIELYYGVGGLHARKLIKQLCSDGEPIDVKSTKDMLVTMLIDPYLDLWGDRDEFKNYEYQKFAKGMLVGSTGIAELGRPKFLSDQIYNKAIFGEIYPDEKFSEMGPNAKVQGALLPRDDSMKVNYSIFRKPITDKEAIELIAIISAHELNSLIVDGRFRDAMKREEINNINVVSLFRIIGDYVYRNSEVDVLTLRTLVHGKIFDNAAGIDTYKKMRKSNDVPGSALAAALTSIIAIIVTWGVKRLISNRSKYGEDLDKWISEFSAGLMLLNNIGSDHQAAATYLGIQKTNAGGNAVAFATEADAREALRLEAYSTRAGNILTKMMRNGGNRPTVFDAATVNFLNITFPQGTDEYNFSTELHQELNKLVGRLAKNVAFGSALVQSPQINVLLESKLKSLVEETMSKVHTEPLLVRTELEQKKKINWLTVPDRSDENIDRSLSTPDNVKQVDVTDIHNILMMVGRLRFDTVFIRNLIFIVNLYRSVRMKLQRDLVYNRDVINKSVPITRAQITEFFSNQIEIGRQPYNPSGNYRFSY